MTWQGTRGAGAARDLFGAEVFDALPKSVLAMLCYRLALPPRVKGKEADRRARLRILDEWDQLKPLGLPVPTDAVRSALVPGSVLSPGRGMRKRRDWVSNTTDLLATLRELEARRVSKNIVAGS